MKGVQMDNNNAIMPRNDNKLLDIFVSEVDRKDTDILAMSNFFDVFIEKIDTGILRHQEWKLVEDAKTFLGKIAAAIKSGYDISNAGTLVADTSHFSKKIIDGLKDGTYHIGESKEVANRLRPAVLDSKGKLVKFVTLKKAVDPTAVLTDLSTLSMQFSLKRITTQIEEVSKAINSVSEFVRREALSNKFINARDKIMQAAISNGDRVDQLLAEADTYLMEGLTSLYSDLNEEIANLSKLSGPFLSLKAVDEILTRINEDMLMIPRYVGVRFYLFNYRDDRSNACRVLGDYRYHMEKLANETLPGGKYTATEMIHQFFPYSTENTDFWIEQPQKMVCALESYELMLAQSENNVYYIES